MVVGEPPPPAGRTSRLLAGGGATTNHRTLNVTKSVGTNASFSPKRQMRNTAARQVTRNAGEGPLAKKAHLFSFIKKKCFRKASHLVTKPEDGESHVLCLKGPMRSSGEGESGMRCALGRAKRSRVRQKTRHEYRVWQLPYPLVEGEGFLF